MTPLSSRWPALLLIGLFATLSIARAADTDVAHPKKKDWNWLTEADKTSLLNSFPPKPEPGSDVDKKDLQDVLDVQAHRTPALIAEAMDDKKFRLELISRVLGPGFTAQGYPATFALLDGVNQNEYLLSSTLKKMNKRKRPFQDHPEVKNLFDVDGFSYPSGHSSGAHTYADILSALFPAKQAELMARGDAVGQSRVTAGVHYPSDVEAGKKLAQELVDALMANPDFQRAFGAAKAEIARQNNG